MLTVGKAYLFHTHLGIWLGKVVAIEPDEIMLDQCSWVQHQGRMGACIREGTTRSHEYVGNGVVIPRTAIKVPWVHPLPTEDK